MSDLSRLNGLKQELDKLRRRKIEIQSDLKSLDKEKTDLVTECKGFDIDPKELDNEILKQEDTLRTKLEEVKQGLENLNVTVR